jgi:hypothetical protein
MRQALTPVQPFPVEGKGFDPLLPSMGRILEGGSTVSEISKEEAKFRKKESQPQKLFPSEYPKPFVFFAALRGVQFLVEFRIPANQPPKDFVPLGHSKRL